MADKMLGGIITILIVSFLIKTCIDIFFVLQVFNVLRGDFKYNFYCNLSIIYYCIEKLCFRSILQVPMGMAGIPFTVVAISVLYTTSKEGHILGDLFRYYKH